MSFSCFILTISIFIHLIHIHEDKGRQGDGSFVLLLTNFLNLIITTAGNKVKKISGTVMQGKRTFPWHTKKHRPGGPGRCFLLRAKKFDYFTNIFFRASVMALESRVAPVMASTSTV